MTIQPDRDWVGPGQDVDQWRAGESVSPGPTALGARRRLRALAARSWSAGAIESRTGIPAFLVDCLTAGRGTASPDLADAIADVYDHLWNRDPPLGTAEERQDGQEARSRAIAGRWAPPLAWDDDKIDLPDGKPERGWKPGNRTTRRRADLMEDAEFVRQNDGYRQASVAQVAMRLGVTRDCLEQAYSRSRRQEARAATREVQSEAEAC